MTGWVEHKGHRPPDLAPGTEVVIRHRGGHEYIYSDPWEFWLPDESDPTDYWSWQTGSESSSDIVAYRIA